jgi:hypothetical protein
MRYRLRTLLIAAAVGPPALAGAWFAAKSIVSNLHRMEPPPWRDLLSLLQPAAGISILVALFIVTAAMTRRVGRSP